MKPEATSSLSGEVTQLAEFPWRVLPSMLSELVNYRHLFFSAWVITFVTITQLSFMFHTFMHSKSIFLGAFVITWDAFQRPFLRLFVISIEVHTCISHVSSVFGFTSVSSLRFLCISFRTFIFTLIALELLIFLILLTCTSDVGSWQNYQVLNRSSFSPMLTSLSPPLSHKLFTKSNNL